MTETQGTPTPTAGGFTRSDVYATTTEDVSCCCEEGEPCCTTQWPLTIYATIASSCPEWDALVIPLVWDAGDGVWRGKYEGTTNACDLELSVNCSSGVSPTVVDFIIGLGESVGSGYYETPDCGPPVTLEFGGITGEEQACCASANIDVMVTE